MLFFMFPFITLHSRDVLSRIWHVARYHHFMIKGRRSMSWMIIKDKLHLQTMKWLRVISGTPRKIQLATCILSSVTVNRKLILICLCRLLRKVIAQETFNQYLTLLKFNKWLQVAVTRIWSLILTILHVLLFVLPFLCT